MFRLTSPKPRIWPKPKPKRLPTRKAVTICAGFKSTFGVVLCADSQETVGALKIDVPKLIIKPQVGRRTDKLRMAFAGAGHGPFIDKLVEKMWQAAERGPDMSMTEIVSRIEAENLEWHRKLWAVYGQVKRPDAEILIAIYADDSVSLHRLTGPIINEIESYGFVGIGEELGTFMAEQVRADFDSVEDDVMVAIYILHNAKKYVDSCGGDTQIAAVLVDGSIHKMNNADVEAMSEGLSQIGKEIQYLFSIAGNLANKREEINKSARMTAHFVHQIRKETRNKIRHLFRVPRSLRMSANTLYEKIEWPAIKRRSISRTSTGRQ